ncbi:MAG: hypothetical protein GDA56_11795 [Hormoscilla sp. GM7CHS1pb]|nr:hypothetical protein [Hormoscilla sp. GM7CHS1pb]
MLDDINTFSEIARNIATVLGILIGGSWSLWVFFLSRIFAGSLIITQTLKEMTTLNSFFIAIIEVRVKNIGRTKVDLEYCSINVGEITDAIYSRDRIYTIGTEPIKVDTKDPTNRAFSQLIFNDRKRIEPNEETSEEIALVLSNPILATSKTNFFRVDVVFKAKGIKKYWTSGAIYKR